MTMTYNEGETEFNSNLATLERIDTLLKNCDNSHFEEDHISYFKHLRNFRKEVWVKIKKKEKYKGEKEEEDNMYKELIDDFSNGTLPEQLLIQLEEYENFLRYSADLRGMLLKDKNDDLRGL